MLIGGFTNFYLLFVGWGCHQLLEETCLFHLRAESQQCSLSQTTNQKIFSLKRPRTPAQSLLKPVNHNKIRSRFEEILEPRKSSVSWGVCFDFLWTNSSFRRFVFFNYSGIIYRKFL